MIHCGRLARDHKTKKQIILEGKGKDTFALDYWEDIWIGDFNPEEDKLNFAGEKYTLSVER